MGKHAKSPLSFIEDLASILFPAKYENVFARYDSLCMAVLAVEFRVPDIAALLEVDPYHCFARVVVRGPTYDEHFIGSLREHQSTLNPTVHFELNWVKSTLRRCHWLSSME